MKPLHDLINLTSKSAIITGGAKGIGKGIAFRLAEAGARVLIADLDVTAAKVTEAEFNQRGWAVKSITADVSNESDVERLVKTCSDSFGSIDILVNNAGIYPSVPLAGMTEADFEKVMHVNLRSAFLTTKYASAIMKKQVNGGRIINITSIDAIRPSMVGLSHYDASKHGLWGFTQNVALELAKYNIQVNAIAPGGIQTPGVEHMQADRHTADDKKAIEAFTGKIPLGRIGQPDDIGIVALFLASDMASYMTGSQVVVDGGALLT